MKHTFTIIVKPYKRENCTLDDMRTIYNGKTCLVAKNNKFGEIYLHKDAKIVKGRFYRVAGSNSSPILLAETEEVHIKVTDHHNPPDIETDQLHKQDIITVISHDM